MKENWQSYKEDGFKVPDAYFENFDFYFEENRRLEAINGSKRDIFSVPQGYFAAVDKRLRQSCEQKPVFSFRPLNRRVFYGALTAAAAVLIFLLLLWNPKAPQTNLDSLSATALNSYLEEEDIQEFLTYDEIVKIENNAAIFQTISLSDEQLYELIDDQVLEEELEPIPNQ